jgi:hypothetical protein
MINFTGTGDIPLTTDAIGPFPVIWAPAHAVIGTAGTHDAALRVAHAVPVLGIEHRTARLATDPNGHVAWFCGPQLGRTYR